MRLRRGFARREGRVMTTKKTVRRTEDKAAPKSNEAYVEAVRLRAAIDNSSTNFMVADADRRIVSLNRSLYKMLSEAEHDIKKELPHFSVASLVGRSIDDFHKNPAHQQHVLRNLQGEHRARIKVAGLTFDLCVVPAKTPEGELVGFVVEWTDMTARLKDDAEKERLGNNAARLQSALEGATTNVMVANENYEIVFMNDAVRQMLTRAESDIRKELPQFRVEGLIGMNIDRFHKNPSHQRNMLANLQGHHKVRLSLGGRSFDLTATAARSPRGTLVGFSVEWVDITDQVKAEHQIEKVLKAALEGDLTQRIPSESYTGFLRTVSGGTNNLLDSVSDSMRHVKAVVEQVMQAATQLRATSQMMSGSSQELNSAAGKSNASLEEAAGMVKTNADNASMANQLVSQTSTAAKGGQEKMNEMSSAMSAINDSSKQIGKIIKVIEEIAFQTNLLALNAAVEAARAGRHGKGFAVVAQEVRNLAERSAKAARETTQLIEDSGQKVSQGVRIADTTGAALTQIVANVVKVEDLVAEIATASEEQSRSIRHVTDAMGKVTEGAQAGSQQSTEVASASEELGRQMEVLKQRIMKFKVADVVASASAGGMPAGMTPEIMEQLMAMMRNQGGHAAAPPSNGSNGHANGHSNGHANGHSNGYSNGHSNGHAPRSVLPLDRDERGFNGF
jgi:methyl-accepting chemotaxis protein